MPAPHIPFRHTLVRVAGLAGLWLLLLMGTGHVQAQTVQRAILTRTPPIYPQLAMCMHIYGTVHLHVTVEPDGTVSHIHAISGHALLQAAAEQAVRQWKFAKGASSFEINIGVDFPQGSLS